MTERLHSLDFLRAFALLMGVLLHVLMLFLEPFDGSEPRLGASIIFIWIHTWRMPLFMLLAGFFTALSLSKRNTGNYSFNRLIRLGVPLLLLWSVIPAIDEEASRLFKAPELISWLFLRCTFHISVRSFVVSVLFIDILQYSFVNKDRCTIYLFTHFGL
jgi:uncharacterized membrane protein